jgi:hypothetical protein
MEKAGEWPAPDAMAGAEITSEPMAPQFVSNRIRAREDADAVMAGA